MLTPLSRDNDLGPFEFGEPRISNREREQMERAQAVAEYTTRRLYYDGEQYEDENEETAIQAGYKARDRRLPEHLRRHAYSSHIAEAVDTLADMLSEGVRFENSYADLLNQFFDESQMADRTDDWFREGLILGDTYAVPHYDPIADQMQVDLWEGEAIWPVYSQQDWRKLDHWSRYRFFYRDEELVDEERLQIVEPWIDEDTGILVPRVVELVFENGEPVDAFYLNRREFGLVHGRGDSRHRLRSAFGDTLISKKVRGTSDRYNALQQLGYRVARQNSFATVAVVGDAAALASSRDDTIAKDVADVLRFPGGTNVEVITLPTDPKMIESNAETLEKNLYREFGLSKMDISDIGGLGTVSGYALEVLNRKDRATHRRIRKNAITGIRAIANKMLDEFAYASLISEGVPWWEINPLEVFPNRDGIEVIVGSGDIVDAVSDREDFVSGVVSRRYVLRRRGLAADEVDRIEAEIKEEADAVASRELESQVAVVQAQAAARPAPTGNNEGGKQVGSTQGST